MEGDPRRLRPLPTESDSISSSIVPGLTLLHIHPAGIQELSVGKGKPPHPTDIGTESKEHFLFISLATMQKLFFIANSCHLPLSKNGETNIVHVLIHTDKIQDTSSC